METLTSSISKTLLPPTASTGFSSVPTLFTLKSMLNPGLSLQSKPIKLHLSHSLSSSFSTHLALSPLQRKHLSPSIVSCVAETTSFWAEQDDQGGDSTTALQDLEQSSEEEEESSWDGPEASLSDWEATGGEVEAAAGTEEEGEEVEEEGEFSEPPEDAKLFVGNLPYDVDSESLARLFEPAGVVEISEVIYNRDTDQSRGFGFVTMSTVEEADKAVEMFNRYDLNGRFLTVNKAAPRGTRPERTPRNFGNNNPAFRLYVGNLPWDTDNGRLEQVFSEYGRVVDARVVFDRETGRSRGFGFVTMSSQSEVNDAIAALDGQTLDGRTVRVNVAEERPRRSF